MSLFWTSISISTTIISAPLSTSDPPTPNNTSTTIAVSPHQPNAPSFTPLPLKGIISVTIPITSTLTSQTSLELSLPRVLIHKQLVHGLHHPNSSPPRDPDHLSLITTYYPGLHHLKQILREGLYIILRSINSGPSYEIPLCHRPKTSNL